MVTEIPSGSAHSAQQQQENVATDGTQQRPKLEQSCMEPSTSGDNGGSIGIELEHQQAGQNISEQDMDGKVQLKTEEPNVDLCLCTSCGQPIHDRFLYKVLDQQFYHEKCLACSVCAEPFRSGTCFSRNCQLFCRDHFSATFGAKCARCSAPIGERTIVRRANQHIYHLDCFQCIVCKRELNTGDQFYLIPMDGRLVCRQDFENAQKESAEMDNGNKRPRTTISAKSLETLKQAYQCSSKPARHVREQLAAQTGLDMRVVQVWFQNRRAKEKRLKKDANRRWAAGQQANGLDGRSASNGTAGGNGSGPGSVPSSSGMHGSSLVFGTERTRTLDSTNSDSGASNNDGDSPIYSIYTNPSDVDVEGGSGEFYSDQNGGPNGVYMPAVTTATSDGPLGGGNVNQSMANGNGAGGGSSMSVLIPSLASLQQQEQQQQMSPHQASPIQALSQQQLYLLEPLNGAGAQSMADPRTPLAGGLPGMAPGQMSQPGTPQQHQSQQQPPQMSIGNGPPLFSPPCPPMMCQNGLLSDQQQQYLLAAAAFGQAPPQMGPIGGLAGGTGPQFMMGMGPGPGGVPDSLPAAFYHPAMGHPMGQHIPFSPLAMHPGHHYQNGQGQPISQ